MRVEVLGSTVVSVNGVAVSLGAPKERRVLAALALAAGRPVPADVLVDHLWADDPPATAATTLQAYVSRLRRALEPGRAARSTSQVLVTRGGGYALLVPEDALDARRFEVAVRTAHAAVGSPTDPGGDDIKEVQADLDQALGSWRGRPYDDLGDAPAAVAERARLEEMRLVALEDRAVAELRLGRHATAAAELEALTSEHPLRERLWGLRALALARSGRQADALEVLGRVRELLAEELGLEPGKELRELQTAVLRQDPGLDLSRPAPERRSRAEWPLVGRDAELASLTDLLDTDRPAFAVLTGEPGIGKSRLCSELADLAEARGATALVGRCSHEQGAPPLHPWADVLGGLGTALPRDADATGDDTAAYRAREGVARAVLRAAGSRPVLVLLDDLHWADTSTLRVLRLLTEIADAGRLLVVATWRDDPPPTGHLAEVAEALARRHAVRLALDGLSADAAAEVVGAVSQLAPSGDEAAALRDRTDGNPFFLVEYARLARERGELAALLDEQNPPAAVQDVLTRRIAALPAPTAALLGLAGVLGRTFDSSVLAGLADLEEEAVLDRLDDALEAGLVREVDVGRFAFAHALVRDTAYLAQTRTRRARLHARAAGVLARVPGRRSEIARHWLAAGPRHASQAWRAAVDAASDAAEVFAFDEAVDLLTAATASIEQDPLAGPHDELDVLGTYAEALQRTSNWVDLRPVVRRSIAIARDLRDVDALVGAATLAMTNAVWQSGSHGVADPVVVAALREALDLLPRGDGEQRCRVMISLSGEIYYGSSPREREALADEGLAMARRLADPGLLQWALLSAATSIWRGGTAERRVGLVVEAAGLARAAGDPIGLSAALVSHVVMSGELAWDPGMPDRLAAARAHAEQHGHLYGELVLDAFELPWAAMRGEAGRVQVLLDDMLRLVGRTSLVQAGDALGAAWAMRHLWLGTSDELVATVQALADNSALPVAPVVAALWCRAGERGRAEAYLAAHPVALEADDWFSPMAWAMTAELAVHLRRRDLASAAYSRLITLRGRVASAGSGAAVGPADAFLAMAAHVVGEGELATQHADEASRLCEQWRIPLAHAWWAAERARLGI